MPTILDEPEKLKLADQHAFNVAVWEKLPEDESLAELPNRIETNEPGQMILVPLLAPDYGEAQANVSFNLKSLMRCGTVTVVCPVSTNAGVKTVAAAWISAGRWEPQRHSVCLTEAPEICIEVISPSNSQRQMRRKKRLYFEAGADEVWFRERDGRMVFFLKETPEIEAEASVLCPKFPARVD